MSKTSKRPKYRVGDWVTLVFGAQQGVAQVVEDRGLLGINKRRLYRVKVDIGNEEPTFIEMPEISLDPVTEADVEGWRTRRSTGLLTCWSVMTTARKTNTGLSGLYIYYLVVAKPGQSAGSGAATIVSMLERRAGGFSPETSERVAADAGGAEAALARAEQLLDDRHATLKKRIVRKWS